jgi:hypothetical protein
VTPLVKKILEAGIIDKHITLMFERWGQLERGSEDLIGKKKISQQTMTEFVDEIETLLETNFEMKETRLEVEVKKPPVDLFCPTTGRFSAVEDVMGKYIVSPKVLLHRGSRIWPNDAPIESSHWVVLEVEPLYQGDVLVSYQVTIEKPE